MINSKASEPWSFGEEVEEISANFIRLRYKLMPYLYSTFVEASETGSPVARSLAIDYTTDENVFSGAFDNQYLFGKSILVAPIGSHDQFLKIYLPEHNEWYEFFTDEKFSGGQEMIREYSLEEFPLFVKGSSIIPVYPDAKQNVYGTGDVLEMHVYNGAVSNAFEYYEDDGATYDFEKGNFHRREVHFDPAKKELRFAKADGAYESKMSKLKVVLHGFTNDELAGLSNLETDTYSFVKPISDFDPFENPDSGKLKIGRVHTLSTDYVPDEMVFNW